jgi:serine/threonine protein kinase
VPSSTESVFRNRALLSGLIDPAGLECAETAIREADGLGPGAEISEEKLVAYLMESDAITAYQVDQLRAGRTKLNLGPYIVTDFIGQGGMGQVFKAEHKVMGRECAVKVLPFHRSTPEAIVTFIHEIRTQAKLDHPNLVHAYDAGHDGNVHYLVTEFVPGTDLRRLIRSEGPLTIQQAASIVMQAALALEYAHERGLIHRDMKPGNILVTPEGTAKVSDLGLANFMNEEGENPRAGKIVGTADYLAPEQIRNPHDITKASDIYSLGCTLYYAVTGKVPFPGGTPGSKAKRHLEETPWHPRRFNPEVSEEFVDVIADMMEKDPQAGRLTAGEVVARLESWAIDAGPIPTYQLTKSRWAPPPLPIDGETQDDVADLEDLAQESSTQASQGTESLSASGQETKQVEPDRSPPVPPPLPSGYERDLGSQRTGPQAWVVLVSMLAGAAAGYLIRGWLG